MDLAKGQSVREDAMPYLAGRPGYHHQHRDARFQLEAVTSR